ncbi:MAG: carboxypeptidase-like regulatory domain-containing protein [Planctomycetaceae bacterium]
MMQYGGSQRLTWIACGLFALCGCGGSDAPELAPVKGTVNYQGKPVENASVTFTPAKGTPASGQTNAEGVFTLTSLGRDGAAVGENVVTITKMEGEAGAVSNAGRDAPPQIPQVSLVPAKYAHPEKSGLKETVEAGKDNDFTFDLTD